MSMDLLVITGIYPPDPGGPAKFASEFRKWCGVTNPEIEVITYAKSDYSKIAESNIKIHSVPKVKSIFLRYIKMIRIIGGASGTKDSILAVGAFLETYVASKIYGFRYVAKVPGDIVWERARNNSITDLDIESFQKSNLPLKYKVFRFLFTCSLLRASLVIVPSKGLYQLCHQWGVPEENLRLVYNSIEVKKFSELSRREIEFDVLTVCRLAPWKGVDEVIEYCSKRNLTLAVAGDGPERLILEKLSKSVGANVTFFGDVPIGKITELLATSKIFVLNSYYEGLPHALVEARAAGLVSVGRSGTGSAEVINDGVDGYLVREDRTLFETIDLALAESSRSSEMGQKASVDSHNKFDQDRNFQEILRVLSEVSK